MKSTKSLGRLLSVVSCDLFQCVRLCAMYICVVRAVRTLHVGHHDIRSNEAEHGAEQELMNSVYFANCG